MQTTNSNLYFYLTNYINQNGGTIPTFEKLGSKIGKLIGQVTVYILIPLFSFLINFSVKTFQFFRALNYSSYQAFKSSFINKVESLFKAAAPLPDLEELVEPTEVTNESTESLVDDKTESTSKTGRFPLNAELFIAAFDNQTYKIIDKELEEPNQQFIYTLQNINKPEEVIPHVTDNELFDLILHGIDKAIEISQEKLNQCLKLQQEEILLSPIP